MNNDEVGGADAIKQLRDGATVGDTSVSAKSGDWPLRKKGYHRALKRKEPWAVNLSKKTGLAWAFAWVYGRYLEKQLKHPNPLLAMIRNENLNGSLPVYFKS